MGLSEKRETVTLGPEVDLGTFEVEKTSTGFLVKAQSQLVHDLFYGWRDIKEPFAEVPRWGVKIYRITTIPNIRDVSFNHIGEPFMLADFVTNLSFLRAVDLDKGVVIKQEGVVAISYLTNLELGLTRGLHELYNEYLRTFKKRIELSTRTLEIT